MTPLLPALEIETRPAPDHAVIWMHGLGADGSDFESVVPVLGLDERVGVRFIFPHAPEIAVTCNNGYVMRAWYDIISLERNARRVDEAGMVQSRQAIRALIERENRRGIPASRIFLAGFSQGGAMAYATALTHPDALAGVIALSTYIPVPALVEAEATAANRGIPVFAAHGRDDDVVSPELGLLARDFLLRHGYACEWHEYAMDHSLCFEEVKDIGRWLAARLGSGRGGQ